MSQVLFDFSGLIMDCLHDKEIKFTNAVSQEIDAKYLLLNYLEVLNLFVRKRN